MAVDGTYRRCSDAMLETGRQLVDWLERRLQDTITATVQLSLYATMHVHDSIICSRSKSTFRE